MDHKAGDWRAQPWSAELNGQLGFGETVLAWFEPDLSPRLQYASGLVVLTDRRVLALAPEDSENPWHSWPLGEIDALRAGEQGSVGTLDLTGPSRRLDHWRYTLGRTPAAHRLVDRFEQFQRDGRIESADGSDRPICPGCGGALPQDRAICPTCEPPPIPRTSSSLVRLLRFARPRAGMVALGFLLTLGSTAASMVPPYLTKPLMDDVIVPRQTGQTIDLSLVRFYLLCLVGAAILTWLLGWARSYVMAWLGERISADMRNQTYAHLLRLSVDFFGGKRTGDLMSRLSSDTDRLNNFLSINLVDFGTDILMILMTTVILVQIDWELAVATLVPIPIIACLVYQVRTSLRHAFQRGNRAWGEMTSILADTIPGIRVVKAFAQEKREIDRFQRSNDLVLKINDWVNRIWAFFGSVVAFLTQLGLLVVWGYGAWRAARNPVSAGTLTLFLAYIGRFYTRLESMSRMVQSTQRAAASAQRIFEILDRVPSVPEPGLPVHPDRLQGEIELRSIGFRYGNRPVLHDLSLTIQPGEMIGLVGPSGAGKSTLINLVCRFFDVREGAILVDGVDIRRYPVEEYRRHIGIVLQEPFLFFGTVAENIAYGRPDASRAQIIEAARVARAHDFILRLPDGYDSMVGERGQSLSGGERQRISIARALLIDPRILILDEATSSVDTQTEREIQEALDNLVRGRTTIAIAHRLSTLRKADRLVVLERGRIAEVGHHHELLRSPGPYSRLHRAQLELAQGVPT